MSFIVAVHLHGDARFAAQVAKGRMHHTADLLSERLGNIDCTFKCLVAAWLRNIMLLVCVPCT